MSISCSRGLIQTEGLSPHKVGCSKSKQISGVNGLISSDSFFRSYFSLGLMRTVAVFSSMLLKKNARYSKYFSYFTKSWILTLSAALSQEEFLLSAHLFVFVSPGMKSWMSDTDRQCGSASHVRESAGCSGLNGATWTWKHWLFISNWQTILKVDSNGGKLVQGKQRGNFALRSL